MGIVSVGRNLVIRQILLTGLVAALGFISYTAVGGLTEMARASGNDAMVAATQWASHRIVLSTVLAAALMTFVSVPVMHYTISRPLKHLAIALDAIAAGDLHHPLPDPGRQDELGAIASAAQRMRERLAAAQAAAVPAGDAELAARRRTVSETIEVFSRDMTSQMERLGDVTRRLTSASDSMIVATRHATEGSTQATSASSHAAGDVSSVATASEQLLDSIEEISRQVVQSTNVVKEAVERVLETNAGMGRLSAAAQKVGDVVSLISRIAAQTNLLALNATIEAARAGEAGRGFAVVAQEVKTLATQTAKATQDITGQISEMQEATELSVQAIDKIQKKINEVEHISTIIAAAVHEQGAATQEIARNVRSAAAGTSTMSSHVENIVRSVDETSASAASVGTLARELDEMTRTMTNLVARVDTFARTVNG